MATSNQTEAYPALFVVMKAVEGDDGVYRTPDTPTESDVLEVVNDALESAGWKGHHVIDCRRGERELQDEIPPEPPVTVEGVTVVFDQSPAPEAEGYYDGPFEVAKQALGEAFDAEVWIDAVVR